MRINGHDYLDSMRRMSSVYEVALSPAALECREY